MKRVVIAGRWDGGIPLLPAGLALKEIARGVGAGAEDVDLVTVPLGPGPTAVEALAGACAHASLVSVPLDVASTREAGERVAELLGERMIIVEGGHNAFPDCGLGFLAGMLGVAQSDVAGDALAGALTRAEELVAARGTALVCAASTARPLLGLDSVLAVAPDLEPIEEQDTSLTGLLTQSFAHRPLGRRQLLGGRDTHPARIPGAGAGGGVGAVIAASGGRIVPTGELLSNLIGLDMTLMAADLVIVAEPELASPLLAESTMDALTCAASAHALPVVALTVRSSLSPHERAQWGLHGVFETEARVTLWEAGRRIAHTWLR